MIFVLILLLINFSNSESTLKLVFSDEFNESDSIDLNKWDVFHDCEYLSHLNCFTKNMTNLRLIDGNLALMALRKNYRNKFYTSAYLVSKESYTGGRFEIRAAIPKGKMLRSSIELSPNVEEYPANGWIYILANNQTKDLEYGIDIEKDSNAHLIHHFSRNDNLNQFTTYVMEWTDSQIKWIFDGKLLETIDLKKELENNDNPFMDKPFKLNIFLGVGGEWDGVSYFPDQTLYEADADKWACSLFMIDYVRIYQFVNETSELPEFPEQNNVTSTDICNKVMPEIRRKKLTWNLVFSDEFNNETIDPNKWLDLQQEQPANRTGHSKLTDGTLILFPFNGNNSQIKTNQTLISKDSFRYGRFEVRAALPAGRFLRSGIHLDPTEDHRSDSKIWSKNGKISLISNIESKKFYYGIHFEFNEKAKYVVRDAETTIITESLFNFHTYVMEWTESEIKWFFDDNHLFTVNVNKELVNNYNPFDKPFKLAISLDAAISEQGEMQNKIDEEHHCSLMILDYVRIYQLSEEGNTTNYHAHNNLTRSVLCDKYMPFTKDNSLKESSLSMIAIISISVAVIFLIIIPLNIILFIRMKNKQISRLSQRHETKPGIEIYDDIVDENYDNYYNFEDNYEKGDQVYENDDPYEECRYIKSEAINEKKGSYVTIMSGNDEQDEPYVHMTCK